MGYLFLTGATGLLGSYLIRDLTRAGVNLAVLVRSTKWVSAQQRIETLVARWEQEAGFALPRPIVFEGDLSRPDFALDARSQQWVADNVQAFMHNAASLTFHAESPEGEPWRSNLHGTSNALEFCRTAGIREFHHVSTAYVCGLRRGLIRESDIDVGQELGNDYEISKLRSEKMVREADFLDNVTVYRPGIILGDSHDGYTSTFHGFYVPLKLISALIDKIAGLRPDQETLDEWIKARSQELWDVLNLQGDEQKNYVPVDWCAAVMSHVYTHPELHRETYHLTPRTRTPLLMTQHVLEGIFRDYTERVDPQQVKAETFDWSAFLQQFLEGMSVYRSYWCDDPEFDTSNTQRVAPHLPCPDIDEAMVEKMCRFALDANFGWPKPPVVKPKVDLVERLDRLSASPNGKASESFVGLQVNGSGGGQWELAVHDGRLRTTGPGVTPRCSATYYLNANTFERLASRKATAAQALSTGDLLIEGNGMPVDQLAGLLQEFASETNNPQ